MTEKLARSKFWIVKPATGINYLKNPRFDPPDGAEDWGASGAGVTVELSGDEQRYGAYSMKVNTASGVASSAYYPGLVVADDVWYTFSCDVKGTAGQAMRIFISDVANNIKATTTFTATGHWQRKSVSWLSTESASGYYVAVTRDSVASTAPFYVDGVQFETASEASTLMHGYAPGCRWEGAVRNSSSLRSGTKNMGMGGTLVDLDDYGYVENTVGLGHGDWNQILTKMTSGGDLYQNHTRKSRNFSIVMGIKGTDTGDLMRKRQAILDVIRPDALEGQEMIVRYQGFDEHNDEITQPIDIVCVPTPGSMTDIPDSPTFQKIMLNFTIPSGLLNGAYNEGAVLDYHADFAAEYIVKRDPNRNWCKWGGSNYASLITGLNGIVRCIAEAPDGKIYAGGDFTDAGGIAGADYLARWNPVTERWETVIAGISSRVQALAFDANGNLYIGGEFTNLGSTDGNRIAVIGDPSGTPAISPLGTGAANGGVFTIGIDTNGDIYAGGDFTSMGGVSNTVTIAKATWNGSGYTWSALATGLNGAVNDLCFAPNGDLYIGGNFTNATTGGYGDYLCYWDGSKFNRVGTAELNGRVYTLDFDAWGNLYVGGNFTNAGGVADADYIAAWNGNSWLALGTGTNLTVSRIEYVYPSALIVSGLFTSAGGLTLTDRVAVWANGAWMPLDIDLPGSGVVNSILHVTDGSIYIGGAYSTTVAGENAECGIVSDSMYAIGVASASANTYPYIQISGPGTLKSISNYSTGKSIAFDGLTLQAGETISLNLDPLNLQFKGAWDGRGNLMRYVVAGSNYGDFYLKPGANYLSLYMTNTDSNSNAWIAWTPRFWGLDGALL